MTDKEFKALERKLKKVDAKLWELQKKHVELTGKMWIPKIIAKSFKQGRKA